METLLAVEEDGTVCPGRFRRTGGGVGESGDVCRWVLTHGCLSRTLQEDRRSVEEDGTVCPGSFRRTGRCVGEQLGRVQVDFSVWTFVQDASGGQQSVWGGAAGTCAEISLNTTTQRLR